MMDRLTWLERENDRLGALLSRIPVLEEEILGLREDVLIAEGIAEIRMEEMARLEVENRRLRETVDRAREAFENRELAPTDLMHAPGIES